MARIEYLYTEGKTHAPVSVRLDGKYVGDIRHVLRGTPGVDIREGWSYFPKGQRTGGEIFPTIQECQNSLQGPEE